MVIAERERVEDVISASRIAICDSVTVGLALGRTYCEMARLGNRPVSRNHLFTLACEALTIAEEYAAVAPSELLSSVLEDAERSEEHTSNSSHEWISYAV